MEHLAAILLEALSIRVRTTGRWKLLLIIPITYILIVLGYGIGAYGAENSDPTTASICNLLAWIIFAAIFILPVLVIIIDLKPHTWRLFVKRNPEDVHAIIERLRTTGQLTQKNNMLSMAAWAGVDLHGLDLHDANMNKIGLEAANLRQMNLRGANLRSARLENADLSGSDLSRATLAYARLRSADLRDAKLVGTDLTAADLSQAKLEGAILCGALFDDFTILPDRSKWTADADLSQFGVNV